MEHELLGFYVTSHPLKKVSNRLRYLTTHTVPQAKEASDGASVIVGGLAISIEKRLTKQNKLLCIIHLEDPLGKLEVVAYSELLEKIAPEVLQPQSLLLIKGKVKKNDDQLSVLASSIRRISDASMVDIFMDSEQTFSDLHRLKDVLVSHKGEDPVLLHFPQGKQSQTILVGSQFWVSPSSEFVTNMHRNFADGVKVHVKKIYV